MRTNTEVLRGRLEERVLLLLGLLVGTKRRASRLLSCLRFGRLVIETNTISVVFFFTDTATRRLGALTPASE